MKEQKEWLKNRIEQLRECSMNDAIATHLSTYYNALKCCNYIDREKYRENAKSGFSGVFVDILEDETKLEKAIYVLDNYFAGLSMVNQGAYDRIMTKLSKVLDNSD